MPAIDMAVNDWTTYVKFLPQGAKIQELRINSQNIVLGFDQAEEYDNDFNPFFGETIGRVANRIAGAEIQRLNGRSYKLKANNGPNALHGGAVGWGRKTFDGPTRVHRNGREAVLFSYLSPDSDEGYPGAVELKVWYYLDVEHDSDGKDRSVCLEIEYEAELVGSEAEETVINVTNHSYFNLTGQPTIEGTHVTLGTSLHQEVDDTAIPTGAIVPFPGTEADKPFVLGAQEPDIDHCFVVNDDPASIAIDTRSSPMVQLCTLHCPATRLRLEASSTEPAFQFYTGRFINVPAVGQQPARGPRSGICVEASRYVNAINQDAWRDMVLLRPGHTYGSRTMYRVSSL